ncbi:MAG: hypothetical protein AB7I01_10700 [Gammaproteobacteria bacterium]
MSGTHARRAPLGLMLSLLSATAAAVPDDGGRPVPPPDNRPSLETLRQLVDEAMPVDVQDDNSKLLAVLLKPQVAPRGPSDGFDIVKTGRLLRLGRPVPGKGCFQPPPNYDCTYSEGSPGGGGAYRELRADSLGNLRFVSRLPDPSRGNPEGGTGSPLPKYSLEDQAALKAFVDLFTGVFQVPSIEVPPSDSWKLRKLALGVADGDKGTPTTTQVIAGMVQVPRMVKVDGLKAPMVPVIGGEVQGAMDDLGVFRVKVNDWTRFTMPERLKDARAPSRRSLVDDIAEQLSRQLEYKPQRIAVEIAYAKGDRFSELVVAEGSEEASPTANAIPDAHRYVPVLMTSVTPMPADSSEEEQNAAFIAEAGFEMVTPLYELGD